MKISTGKYDVIESGSVVIPQDDYLEFEVEGLNYRFTFSDEKEADKPEKRRVTGALVAEGGKQVFRIDVINYNSLFTTPAQPLEVGNLDGGNKLYVYFSVVSVSADGMGKTRVFHYTWFKSREVKNGTDNQ